MDETHQFQLRRRSFASPGYKGKPVLASTKKTDRVATLVDEGKDVTPKPLNPEIYGGGKERQIGGYEVTGPERLDVTVSGSVSLNIFKSQSTARFRTDLDKQQIDQSVQYKGSLSYGSNFLDAFLIDSSSEQSSDTLNDTFRTNSEELDFKEDNMKDIPTHISLMLSETNTFILLDIPSSTAIKDSDEGIIVEEKNTHYEYLTVGKGRNRKVLHAEVQTVPILKKSRNTDSQKIKTRCNYAYVSNYDMYDTYQELAEDAGEDSDDSEESDIEPHKVDDTSSVDSYRMSQEDKQLNKLVKNPKFLEAVCVIERLLANNCYNEQQKWFRGLSAPSDFREDIEYNYKLELLWTFANSDTTGRSVSAVHWNPANKDLLAVGYGKFYFADNLTGLVLIWNIKNPVQPERRYTFHDPVTALNFSKSSPNLLAVGCYNGHVVILNIVSRETLIIGENTPPFEPVWNLVWQQGHNEYKNMELVCATFADGRICLYSLWRKLREQQIMRVAKAEGKLKGYDSMRKCTSVTIPISRYAAAFIYTPHPTDSDIYYIGTNEGVVHKCSKNYFNQHLDLFLAHRGTIHKMKFSPFSSKIFATCGDDWNSRLWAEDIDEPILEFYMNMVSVQGYDWSPTLPTIVATIRGAAILVWDLQRKAYAPQSTTRSPTGSRNTIIEFTDSGRCVVVGDIEGNVHFFALKDMPFQAFFPENLLFDSLYRALITKPEILRKLKKLRKSTLREEKYDRS